MSGSESNQFNVTKEDVRKLEARTSAATGGNIPKTSDAAVLQVGFYLLSCFLLHPVCFFFPVSNLFFYCRASSMSATHSLKPKTPQSFRNLIRHREVSGAMSMKRLRQEWEAEGLQVCRERKRTLWENQYLSGAKLGKTERCCIRLQMCN